MVFYSQQMLRIAVELALHEPLYEEFVEKFFEHTLLIAGAMDRMGDRHDEMWDEEDGFFYDVLRLPDGGATRLKVRSIVGLLPLAAVAVFEDDILDKLPHFRERAQAFGRRHPELIANLHLPGTARRGQPAHAGHRRRAQAAPHPGADARRERVLRPARHPRAVAPPPGPSVRVPPRRAGLPRGLRARRFRQRHVRRQLELARPGLDAGQLPALQHAAAAPPLLRRRLQGGMPDRLGPDDDAAAKSPRSWASGWRGSS